MNSKLIILGALVVVLILGVISFNKQSDTQNITQSEEASIQKNNDTMSVDSTMESDVMMEKEEGDSMMEPDVMMEKKDEAMMEPDTVMESVGTYEPYSAEKIAQANSGDVVLFFKAGWCPTCRVADANLKSNRANIPAGLTILEVDYDAEVELKKKYGVTYQHTFVQVDGNGDLIKKWSGSLTLASITKEVQ